MKLYIIWQIHKTQDSRNIIIESHRTINSIWFSEELANKRYNEFNQTTRDYWEDCELEEIWTNDGLVVMDNTMVEKHG